MHKLIHQLLSKRGIQSVDQLDKEERQTFDNWQAILSKEQMTVDDIKHFCEAQIATVESKWKDLDKDNAKKAELIPYHTVYKSLLMAITAPQSQRKVIEDQLNQMLNI